MQMWIVVFSYITLHKTPVDGGTQVQQMLV
jgi:hypothetical protein